MIDINQHFTYSASTEGKAYNRCKNCLMDTSDPKISFDAQGSCIYCQNFLVREKTLGTTQQRKNCF